MNSIHLFWRLAITSSILLFHCFNWRTKLRSFQVGAAAERPSLPAGKQNCRLSAVLFVCILLLDLLFIDTLVLRICCVYLLTKMGCAGFTCSKHSLCALNILYVVSIHSRMYHMDHYTGGLISRRSVLSIMWACKSSEGNVLLWTTGWWGQTLL